MRYELPVTDQAVIDAASPEVSRLANCIGYALAERGTQVTADDTIAAAQRLVDQGLDDPLVILAKRDGAEPPEPINSDVGATSQRCTCDRCPTCGGQR